MNVKFYRCEGPAFNRIPVRCTVVKEQDLSGTPGLATLIEAMYIVKGVRGGVYTLWLMKDGGWKLHNSKMTRSWPCVEVEFV